MNPKDSWPLSSKRKGQMTVNFDAKNFSSWRSNSARKAMNHISSVWHDIECTNFLIDHAFRALCALHPAALENDREADKQERMWIEILETLSRSIYRDLHIICQIIKKEAECPDSIFTPVSQQESYKRLKNKILEIRNLIVEHREKPNFYTPIGSRWTSSSSGTDLVMVMMTDKGKHRTIQFDPLADAEQIRCFLDSVRSKEATGDNL